MDDTEIVTGIGIVIVLRENLYDKKLLDVYRHFNRALQSRPHAEGDGDITLYGHAELNGPSPRRLTLQLECDIGALEQMVTQQEVSKIKQSVEFLGTVFVEEDHYTQSTYTPALERDGYSVVRMKFGGTEELPRYLYRIRKEKKQ